MARARQRLEVAGASPSPWLTVAPSRARSRARCFMKKSRMPCFCGTFPVAMLAQMMGLLVRGSSDLSFPEDP